MEWPWMIKFWHPNSLSSGLVVRGTAQSPQTDDPWHTCLRSTNRRVWGRGVPARHAGWRRRGEPHTYLIVPRLGRAQNIRHERMTPAVNSLPRVCAGGACGICGLGSRSAPPLTLFPALLLAVKWTGCVGGYIFKTFDQNNICVSTVYKAKSKEKCKEIFF